MARGISASRLIAAAPDCTSLLVSPVCLDRSDESCQRPCNNSSATRGGGTRFFDVRMRPILMSARRCPAVYLIADRRLKAEAGVREPERLVATSDAARTRRRLRAWVCHHFRKARQSMTIFLNVLAGWFATACILAAIFAVVVSHAKRRAERERINRVMMRDAEGYRGRSTADAFGSRVVARDMVERDSQRPSGQ